MKRSLLSLISLLFVGGTLSALDVSTEPQFKNALLEEFTGINCGNCPDGHEIAAKLHLAQPEKVHIIAIHAGYYAQPDIGDPDLITEEGTAINEYYYVNSYPSGMVNRSSFEWSTQVLTRALWNQCAREICQEISPVNLAIECDYDEYKREYKVTVAGYYTSTPESQTNNLCVALVQNNIKGYQAGSGMSYDYVHQHVLRDYFTPVWGDPIESITEGSKFEKTYTLTLPEVIGNIDVVPAQLEVVAFVTAGEGSEVLNVTSGRANPAMFDLPLAAEISAYKIPVGQNYGYNFLDLYIDNQGSETITEATFNVTLNGATSQVKWTGQVPPMEKQAVQISVDWQSTQTNDNTYSVELTGLNGKDYEGNSFNGTFGAIVAVPTTAIVKFKSDNYFSDNTFTLKDDQSNTVQSFGPYEEGVQAVYEETVTFEPGKVYCFEITDAWGNGILSPRGNLKIYDSESNLLTQNLNITDHGMRIFVKANEESGIDEINSANDITIVYDDDNILIDSPAGNTVAIYNITGRCAYAASGVSTIPAKQFPAGLYIVKVSSANGSKSQKITVK